MGLTYFKRFRMETNLGRGVAEAQLPAGYWFLPWDESLLDVHAEVKFQSFREEIDSNVFPCLGDLSGCTRLMAEISQKPGFLPPATWLVAYDPPTARRQRGGSEYCGTIQGIRDRSGMGAIQNLGVSPEHRGQGLGQGADVEGLARISKRGHRTGFLRSDRAERRRDSPLPATWLSKSQNDLQGRRGCVFIIEAVGCCG